jgi:hypothetical protein
MKFALLTAPYPGKCHVCRKNIQKGSQCFQSPPRESDAYVWFKCTECQDIEMLKQVFNERHGDLCDCYSCNDKSW